MTLPELSIRRPVFASVMSLVILLVGFITVILLPDTEKTSLIEED